MSTQKEVTLVFAKEVTEKAMALSRELLALRTDLCVTLPEARAAIVAAFSDPIYNSREIADKAERLEGMIRRGRS